MCQWCSGGAGGGVAVVAGGRRRRYRAAARRQERRQSAAEGAAVAGAAAGAGRRRGGVLRVQVGICGMSPKESAAHPSFAHLAMARLCRCDLLVSVAAVLAATCIFWPTLARRLPTAGLALGNMPSQHCALSCPGVPATACSGQGQSCYSTSHGKSRKGPTHGAASCREQLAVGEEVQVMPCHAHHVFHTPCLAPWLKEHNSCPVRLFHPACGV